MLHGDGVERWTARLAARRSQLFLAGGVLLVGYASLNALTAGTAASYAPYEDVVGPAGFALGFLAAMGVASSLSAARPRLARVGAACLAIGVVGFGAITIQGLVVLAGGPQPGPTGPFVVLATIGMLPGYLATGAVWLLTSERRRKKGYGSGRVTGALLFAPALVYAAMVTQAILFAAYGAFTPERMLWSAVVISGAQALAHLGLAASLRRDTGIGVEVTATPDEVATG